MSKSLTPLVYADAALFFNVIKREDGLWKDSLNVLLAADRGDIKLVASTLLPIEISGWKGDCDVDEQDSVLDRYLMNSTEIAWVEVDYVIVRKARELSRRFHLRGADAAHLATAIRIKADYFMSRDRKFPYGQRVDGVLVSEPTVVWQPTLLDDL